MSFLALLTEDWRLRGKKKTKRQRVSKCTVLFPIGPLHQDRWSKSPHHTSNDDRCDPVALEAGVQETRRAGGCGVGAVVGTVGKGSVDDDGLGAVDTLDVRHGPVLQHLRDIGRVAGVVTTTRVILLTDAVHRERLVPVGGGVVVVVAVVVWVVVVSVGVRPRSPETQTHTGTEEDGADAAGRATAGGVCALRAAGVGGASAKGLWRGC